MTEQLAIDLPEARAARDAGMALAIDHAERVSVGWGEAAFHFLRMFCATREHFISEDVSDASRAASFEQPPTDRAWGSVYRRAAKAGLITQDGTGRSRRRHASICPRWRSLVYRSAA